MAGKTVMERAILVATEEGRDYSTSFLYDLEGKTFIIYAIGDECNAQQRNIFFMNYGHRHKTRPEWANFDIRDVAIDIKKVRSPLLQAFNKLGKPEVSENSRTTPLNDTLKPQSDAVFTEAAYEELKEIQAQFGFAAYVLKQSSPHEKAKLIHCIATTGIYDDFVDAVNQSNGDTLLARFCDTILSDQQFYPSKEVARLTAPLVLPSVHLKRSHSSSLKQLQKGNLASLDFLHSEEWKRDAAHLNVLHRLNIAQHAMRDVRQEFRRMFYTAIPSIGMLVANVDAIISALEAVGFEKTKVARFRQYFCYRPKLFINSRFADPRMVDALCKMRTSN